MHEAAYAALGLDGWHYQLLPVPPELLNETVRALPGAGFAGTNVTIPHKETALAVADTASDAAREIGAANTLTFGADGSIEAHNTDAGGLLAALDEDVTGRSALVLGAGGSARAAIWALRGAGADVAVHNRTRSRAEGLGARVLDAPEPADILVNCTSVGLDDDAATPLEDPSAYAVVVDLVYRDGGTELCRRAEAAGVRTVDGLEVLVRQGALSFEHWTGLDAPVEAMRSAARASK